MSDLINLIKKRLSCAFFRPGAASLAFFRPSPASRVFFFVRGRELCFFSYGASK